ncbi:hypothetical protein [Nonomuraea rubra]|uniref:hypothetical protein n=1 Tax=Nonomuraea rubra TaxID=46180 RepID=UPI0031EEB26F
MRSACRASTPSPPVHSASESRCSDTDEVARSWLGEEEVCPVSGAGSSVAIANTSSPAAAPAVMAPRENSAMATPNSTTSVSATPWVVWVA